jgi:hypothetical protein
MAVKIHKPPSVKTGMVAYFFECLRESLGLRLIGELAADQAKTQA